MPVIDEATSTEIATLASMRRLEGWTSNLRLLEIAHRSAQCRVFVVRDAQPLIASGAHAPDVVAPVASALAVSYGARGFIGNVVVQPSVRRRGLGEALMRAAMAWLTQQGTPLAELDATQVGRSLYQRLGFAGSAHSWELAATCGALTNAIRRTCPGKTGEAVDDWSVERLDVANLSDIAELDLAAFGGNRLDLVRRLVVAFGAAVYVARRLDAAPCGYLIVRALEEPDRGLHIGPWVAQTPPIALALLSAMLEHAGNDDQLVYANVPGASTAPLHAMGTWGISLRQDDLRMRRHLLPERPPPADRAEWIYAMLSAMLG